MFGPPSTFQLSLIFASMVSLNMVKHIKGRLLALAANIRPDWKGLPGTKTLAYRCFLWVTKKKVLLHWHLEDDVTSWKESGISGTSWKHWIFWPRNTKGGSITVLLTSCLTGLESAVWLLTIFVFYLQNRLIQTSQTGGEWYNDISPFSIPCFGHGSLTEGEG